MNKDAKILNSNKLNPTIYESIKHHDQVGFITESQE